MSFPVPFLVVVLFPLLFSSGFGSLSVGLVSGSAVVDIVRRGRASEGATCHCRVVGTTRDDLGTAVLEN